MMTLVFNISTSWLV